MINAQKELLGLGATVLAAVSLAAKAKEGMEAKEKSKKNYELAVQQKQENIKLTKARLAEVEARTASAEALNKAKIENTEAKTAAILGNTEDSKNIANAKVDAINAKTSIDKAKAKKINAETKQIKSKTALNAANTDLKTAKTAQINAQVERMAKLAEKPAAEEAAKNAQAKADAAQKKADDLKAEGKDASEAQAEADKAKEKAEQAKKAAEEAPAPKQKYILSEEGANFPITAENSETNIEVDEDVKKLQEVKANIEKHNIPETAKTEEPTEDRLDWHNYADKFYEGIGYEAAEEKVKEKYGKTVSELYGEETSIKEKLEQLKSTIDLEKYRPTENDPTPNGGYYYQNVVWDRLYKDYPEYKELEKQIGEKTDIANEAFRMRDKLAQDSNSLTLEDFGFSKEEQDEWAELNKKSLNKKSKNYARWDELEKKRVGAAFARKNVINSYYKDKEKQEEKQEFNDKSEKLYKVWETKAKSQFNEYRGKKLPAKVQEAYDRIDNKKLTYDTWQDDLDTVNTYFQKQWMKKNKKENK